MPVAGERGKLLEPAAELVGDRGAAESAREDADQRDSDLHGRKKPAGIGDQPERHARAAVTPAGEIAEPRVARRHDRKLGHRQEAVHQDHQTDQNKLDVQHVREPCGGRCSIIAIRTPSAPQKSGQGAATK